PTAHLDPDARRALTADLLDATRGRATLLITHDLDGLDQVDEIIVLDHGRITERGRHEQLAAGSGVYQRMWAAHQAGAGRRQGHAEDPGPKARHERSKAPAA